MGARPAGQPRLLGDALSKFSDSLARGRRTGLTRPAFGFISPLAPQAFVPGAPHYQPVPKDHAQQQRSQSIASAAEPVAELIFLAHFATGAAARRDM
ncbi:hypothetical protein M673_02295 [Aureimonas sp. AU20]|nr:hypothetical protein M673_02295 [Aureimonas sp. AU20]